MRKSALIIITLMSIGFSSLAVAQVERSQLSETINQREPASDLGNVITVQAGELRKVFFFTQITHLANQQITQPRFHRGSRTIKLLRKN